MALTRTKRRTRMSALQKHKVTNVRKKQVASHAVRIRNHHEKPDPTTWRVFPGETDQSPPLYRPNSHGGRAGGSIDRSGRTGGGTGWSAGRKYRQSQDEDLDPVLLLSGIAGSGHDGCFRLFGNLQVPLRAGCGGYLAWSTTPRKTNTPKSPSNLPRLETCWIGGGLESGFALAAGLFMANMRAL